MLNTYIQKNTCIKLFIIFKKSSSSYLKEQNHRLSERLKVVNGIESSPMLDVHEEGHPEDGEDEHDEEEQQADVEERRHGHGEREEKSSNPARSFDESENTPDFGDSDDSEECRRHEVLLDQVAQYDA
jgi:hypothetical protein